MLHALTARLPSRCHGNNFLLPIGTATFPSQFLLGTTGTSTESLGHGLFSKIPVQVHSWFACFYQDSLIAYLLPSTSTSLKLQQISDKTNLAMNVQAIPSYQ
jgi:hypothetical protein